MLIYPNKFFPSTFSLMTSNYFIGIDIGTSAAKVVVVDSQGHLLGWAGQEYPILTP